MTKSELLQRTGISGVLQRKVQQRQETEAQVEKEDYERRLEEYNKQVTEIENKYQTDLKAYNQQLAEYNAALKEKSDWEQAYNLFIVGKGYAAKGDKDIEPKVKKLQAYKNAIERDKYYSSQLQEVEEPKYLSREELIKRGIITIVPVPSGFTSPQPSYIEGTRYGGTIITPSNVSEIPPIKPTKFQIFQGKVSEKIPTMEEISKPLSDIWLKKLREKPIEERKEKIEELKKFEKGIRPFGQVGYGIYQSFQEKPVTFAATTAAFFALPATFAAVGAGAKSIGLTAAAFPITAKVGGTILKVGLPLLYGVSVEERIRAAGNPELAYKRYVKEIEQKGVPIGSRALTKDEFYIEYNKIAISKGETVGRIIGGEIVPMTLGGWLGVKFQKFITPYKKEIPLREPMKPTAIEIQKLGKASYRIFGEIKPPIRQIKTSNFREFFGIKPISIRTIPSRTFIFSTIYRVPIGTRKPFLTSLQVSGRKFQTISKIQGYSWLKNEKEINLIINQPLFRFTKIGKIYQIKTPYVEGFKGFKPTIYIDTSLSRVTSKYRGRFWDVSKIKTKFLDKGKPILKTDLFKEIPSTENAGTYIQKTMGISNKRLFNQLSKTKQIIELPKPLIRSIKPKTTSIKPKGSQISSLETMGVLSSLKNKEKIELYKKQEIKPIQIEIVKPIQISKTIQIITPSQIEVIKPIEVIKSVQILQPITTQQQLFKIPKPVIPIITPIIKIEDKLKLKKVLEKKETRNIFESFIRRRKKDISLGKFGELGTAKTKLIGKIKTTLGASGFITKGGEKIPFKELKLGYEFTPSKKQPFRLVQKRDLRLSSRGEVQEILSSKKAKGRKVKWL